MLSALLLFCLAQMSHGESGQQDDAFWGDWTPLAGGYAGRRREPPKLDLPPSERRLETAQQHGILKKSTSAAVTAAVVPVTANELWLYTSEEGLHSASMAALGAHTGKGEKTIRKKAEAGKLSLRYEGRPLAWHFDPASDAIWFAAEPYHTFYTDANAFHFSTSAEEALPMEVRNDPSPATTGQASSFTDSLHFEEEPAFFYVISVIAGDPDADFWFWDYLWAGFRDSIAIPLNVPDPTATGTAQIRISLRGATNLDAGDEHEVYAELNGVQVGSSVVWDGFDGAELVADFDQDLLDPDGNNTLTLRNAYTPGTYPAQYLDAIDLVYSRRPVAANGALWLHGAAGGPQRVDGFNTGDIVVIESPTGTAVIRNDTLIEPDGAGGWMVSFDASAGADYLVTRRGATLAATLAPDFPSALAGHDKGEYLIIAPREFAGTAQAMATFRSNRFGHVQIAWLDDIYDEFAFGREDPSALSRFVDHAMSDWNVPPSYILLLGNGTLDHKDRMGYGDSYLPIALTSTPWAAITSDDELLELADGAGPAVGRLPIVNETEGMAYVAKLADQESGQWLEERDAALLVSDDSDEAGDFVGNSEQLRERMENDLGLGRVDTLYHPDDPVTASLALAATWNVGYVGYEGHGSITQLGDENFFNRSKAENLANQVHPVFTALTCSAGWDANPAYRSLASALVLNSQGGALAALVPSGFSLDYDAQKFAVAFADNLFGAQSTVGQATRNAKLDTFDIVSNFMTRIYGVTGDPAVYAR